MNHHRSCGRLIQIWTKSATETKMSLYETDTDRGLHETPIKMNFRNGGPSRREERHRQETSPTRGPLWPITACRVVVNRLEGNHAPADITKSNIQPGAVQWARKSTSPVPTRPTSGSRLVICRERCIQSARAGVCRITAGACQGPVRRTRKGPIGTVTRLEDRTG